MALADPLPQGSNDKEMAEIARRVVTVMVISEAAERAVQSLSAQFAMERAIILGLAEFKNGT